MDFDEWCEENIDLIGEKLADLRGGCSCHISPPCGNHCNPITEDEAEELGWGRGASDTKPEGLDAPKGLPLEIFIRSAADTWFRADEIDLTGEEARYLRSDLTCGDCAHRTGAICLRDMTDLWRCGTPENVRKHPACMVFSLQPNISREPPA